MRTAAILRRWPTDRRLRASEGFALTELLVVVAMLTVVLGAVLGLLATSVRVAPEHQDQAHVIREGQVGLERMTRELRQASEATIASPLEVAFTTYVRDDGGPATQFEVTYECVDGGECWRYARPAGAATPPEQTDRLLTGVTNDDVFTGTPSAATPRYISIAVALASRGGSQPIVLRDGVELRNYSGS